MTDGIRLVVRDFAPPNSHADRTLLWCHGIGEHGGRYEHVVREFLAHGWRVILPDLRGHGQSDGLRADVGSFNDYLGDFDQIVVEYGLRPARTALFGHSMGGLVMARYAQTRPRGWAALAMSAPLLGVEVPIPWWKWRIGRLLSFIAPRTHLRTGIQEANLTHNPEFLARRRADPLIQRSVTVRWFFEMLSALGLAHREADHLSLPVLILQGTADRTTDPVAPEEWLPCTKSANGQIIKYPDGLHELLNDTNWQAVCADLIDWLERHTSSACSA